MAVPGYHELAIAVPWGGMSHPIWFQNDPRVGNVRAIGGVLNRAVMENVGADGADVRGPDPPARAGGSRRRRSADIAASLQAGMPPRENPRINRSVDSVHASGPLGRPHVVIHGNCNYKQTGLLQAFAAYSLVQRAPQRVGFASACQAFGYQELLGQLRAFGLVVRAGRHPHLTSAAGPAPPGAAPAPQSHSPEEHAMPLTDLAESPARAARPTRPAIRDDAGRR